MQKALVILLILSLVSCATAYKPLGWGGGYSSVQINNTQYMVSFEGNRYTSATTTLQYAIQRGRELCNGNVNILGQNSDTKINNVFVNNKNILISKPSTNILVECIK